MAFVVDQRCRKRLEAAGHDGLASRLDPGLHIGRHAGGDGLQPHQALTDATPHRLRLPAARQHCARNLRVVAAPVVRHGRQLGLRREGAHVALVGDHAHAAGLEVGLRSLRHRRRAAVVRQHVGALVDERLRGFAFARRVEPGVEPQHPHLRLRVYFAHAEREGIDALHHLGHREAGHIAGDAAAAGLAGEQAGEVAGLVITRVVRAQIRGRLVAACMLDLDVRVSGRDAQRRLEIAKAGGEYQRVALRRQVAHHAL